MNHTPSATPQPFESSTAPSAKCGAEHRGQLFRKYLLLILTLVTIALIASGAISIYFTYQDTKASLASLQHEKAIAAAARIEQYVHQIEQQLAYAALPQLDPGDVELRRIEFLRLLRQAPEVTDVAQIDASGRERIAVSRLGMDSINSGKDRSQEPAFIETKPGRAWYGPVYFRKETEPYMTIALRGSGAHGTLTAAEVNLKFIWDVVSRIRIGDNGKAYVVDDKGFLVADPDIGLVLRKTNLADLAHVKAALASRENGDLARVSTNLAGTPVLTSVAPIESLNWNVFVEQPVSEVYAKLYASIVRAALLLLAGLGLSALGALALARGMVRPIRVLEEGAQRIGAGDLDQRIYIRTGDELEALAGRFNDMTTALRESYAGLERKVETRTRELQSALDQQTAISEILRVIAATPGDVKPMLSAVAERALELCDAAQATIVLTEPNGLRCVAAFGSTLTLDAGELLPLTRGSVAGRAIFDRAPFQVEDLAAASEDDLPVGLELQRRIGHRTALAVPLMREDHAIGAIQLWRMEKRNFSERQIALVKTFADQAAIAIENVRLFNETREALERQTAMSEILRVISRSPTDVQPVFDTIAAAALRLCDASAGLVFRFDGELVHLASIANLNPASADAWRSAFPRPPSHDTATTRAILTSDVVMIPDVLEDSEYRIGTVAATTGFRSAMSVPLIRDGKCIGAIGVGRSVPGAFHGNQISLLKTFADQAVIAIENARLFNETKEALERQTATAEVLKVISGSPTNLQPVFDSIAERAAVLSSAKYVYVTTFDGELIHMGAVYGPGAEAHRKHYPMKPSMGTVVGRVVLTRTSIEIPDMLVDAGYEQKESAVDIGFRCALGVPMIREDHIVGCIVVLSAEAGSFPGKVVELLKTFADQAVIAIENARLFNETNEALEQQTAVAEILRVISSSPTDVQPVLEAIAERAAKLCDASAASMYLIEGGALRHLASKGPSPDPVTHVDTLPVDRETMTGRAVLERRTIHVPDLLAIGDEYPRSREIAQRHGHRTVVVMPLFREGQPFGAILLRRNEVRAFSEREIALLRTFGDQAAIALENVRLFNETREALEQQRAAGEVLAAISSSIADTAPVFERILASCTRLFEGTFVGINLVDDNGLVRIAAYHGPKNDELERIFPFPLDDTSAAGRAIRSGSAVHYPDIDDDAEDVPERGRKAWRLLGVKAAIGAPMIWEGRGIGVILVGRGFAGRFSDKEIALLKTFADQAAIAIQNVRLFREIDHKSRQLEIANKHKSEFLANMSHELRTPLNAIIGFSEVLLERLFGDVNDKQEDYLKDIHSSGKHLLSLINDILDLSKIEAGRMELEPSRFDIASAISNALTLVRERAQRHGIALAQDVDPALGSIVADERKFKQILLNLLSNAVKFTLDGGRIDVIARRVGDAAEIAVRDTGIGIAPEDQAAVFEEFRQVGRDYTRKQEGTGLGLALTRRFVELHGGTISLASAPARGSTFTFTIPLARGAVDGRSANHSAIA
ncbi:MAG TPA: GAF domain-containing protein [Casimicrobiaceae bacterium]|nr:GAF domain-containing protein [Casimicrobiaceae bacterium]